MVAFINPTEKVRRVFFNQVSNWPLNLLLWSGGAELDNARLCGDVVKLAFRLFLCFGGVCTSVNEQQQEFYEALMSDKGRLLVSSGCFKRKEESLDRDPTVSVSHSW